MVPLPDGAFRRFDEEPDEEFYRTPRLVTHIDDQAIAAVTQLYREYFPPGGEILDLMSSWISHLPPEIEYRRAIGLGMNEVELRRNDRLDSYVVQNLNAEPLLPFGSAEFDAEARTKSLLEDNLGMVNRERLSLEKTCQESAQLHHQLQETLQRSKQILRFFDRNVPADQIVKDLQTEKYVEAKQLIERGVDASQVARKLGISLSEVALLSHMR